MQVVKVIYNKVGVYTRCKTRSGWLSVGTRDNFAQKQEYKNDVVVKDRFVNKSAYISTSIK